MPGGGGGGGGAPPGGGAGTEWVTDGRMEVVDNPILASSGREPVATRCCSFMRSPRSASNYSTGKTQLVIVPMLIPMLIFVPILQLITQQKHKYIKLIPKSHVNVSVCNNFIFESMG